jgi:Txe/YoeB family toxin of Txe-Axe toxin-antitoxin module
LFDVVYLEGTSDDVNINNKPTFNEISSCHKWNNDYKDLYVAKINSEEYILYISAINDLNQSVKIAQCYDDIDSNIECFVSCIDQVCSPMLIKKIS